MNPVVAITLGSSLQITLFLIPFLVVLGWFLDIPMSLSNGPFMSLLMNRLPKFPSCGHVCVGYIYGISDYGWKFKLDGRGDVVGRL
jgi:hypothetical protein